MWGFLFVLLCLFFINWQKRKKESNNFGLQHLLITTLKGMYGSKEREGKERRTDFYFFKGLGGGQSVDSRWVSTVSFIYHSYSVSHVLYFIQRNFFCWWVQNVFLKWGRESRGGKEVERRVWGLHTGICCYFFQPPLLFFHSHTLFFCMDTCYL